MTSTTLTLTYTTIKLPEAHTELMEQLKAQAKEVKGQLVAILAKTELANCLQKTPRTIARYVKQLEDLKCITTVSRSGKNGGTAVIFNAVNPLHGENKELEAIREKVFPKNPQEEPKKHYRNKTQIAEARLAERLQNEKYVEWNDEIEELRSKNAIDKEFFAKTDEPYLNWQTYIFSELVTAYSVVFPEVKQREYHEGSSLYKALGTLKGKYYSYNYLPHRPFGSARWTCLKKAVTFLLNNDINPAAYLSVQFNRVFWIWLKNKSTPNTYIPMPNMLISSGAIAAYDRACASVRKQRDYNLITLAKSEKAITLGVEYPIIAMLTKAWNMNAEEPDEQKLTKTWEKELLDIAMAPCASSVEANLSAYTIVTKKEIEEREDLTEVEKDEAIKFLITNMYSHINATSSFSQIMLAKLSFEYTISTGILFRKEEEDLRWVLGNMFVRQTNIKGTIDRYKKHGKAVKTSLTSNKYFNVMFNKFGRHLGYKTDLVALRDALYKLKDVLPVVPRGVLDFKEIYAKIS
jgi:hypothetical protein